jgi:hypothetical protein
LNHFDVILILQTPSALATQLESVVFVLGQVLGDNLGISMLQSSAIS